MTIQEIRDTVAEARRATGKLLIIGYRNSAGELANYKVEFLPPGGYDQLVDEALKTYLLLEHDGLLTQTYLGIPAGVVDEMDFKVWLGEQADAWRKRITTPADQRTTLDSTQGYDIQPGGYFTKRGREEETTLFGLRCLSKVTREEAPGGSGNWNKTRVKKALAAVTPMGDFLGQMNLHPAKLEGLQVTT